MNYIKTPLTFEDADAGITVAREIESDKIMLDNLVELIVFTRKGSFCGDPDFGFEFWNYEYSNVDYRNFNSEQTGLYAAGMHNEITKKECEESVRNSLSTYAPQLKRVHVSVNLLTIETENEMELISSKYMVQISVEGEIDNGLGTVQPYEKSVLFYMEPTARKYNN